MLSCCVAIQYRKQPMMLPWGLPPDRGFVVERWPPTFACITRPVRKDLVSANEVSKALRRLSLSRQNEWSSLLNAFSKSIPKTTAGCPLSSGLRMASNKSTIRWLTEHCLMPHTG